MSDMAIDYQRRPITVEEYHRMGELGFFGPEERVELLDGELIAVPPVGESHASAIERLNWYFITRLGERAGVRPQLPTRVSRISEPEPDFAIVVRRADFHASGHPQPPETFALVECADSSLRYDRGKKLSAYARGGVREYWIVNLVEACVEVYGDPNDVGYGRSQIARAGESLAFAAFPDVAFSVAELLGTDVG